MSKNTVRDKQYMHPLFAIFAILFSIIYISINIIYKPDSIIKRLTNFLHVNDGCCVLLTGDYGWVILLLVLTIALGLLPLVIRQSRLKAIVQEKTNELIQRYKDHPEEFQKKMMELYQEHKFNPFSGCLLQFLFAFLLVAVPYMYFLGCADQFAFKGAKNLALKNNYIPAIEKAREIQESSSLYKEAKKLISDWSIKASYEAAKDGKYEDAIILLKSVNQSDPQNNILRVAWGNQLAKQGQYELALKKYKSASYTGPEVKIALYKKQQEEMRIAEVKKIELLNQMKLAEMERKNKEQFDMFCQALKKNAEFRGIEFYDDDDNDLYRVIKGILSSEEMLKCVGINIQREFTNGYLITKVTNNNSRRIHNVIIRHDIYNINDEKIWELPIVIDILDSGETAKDKHPVSDYSRDVLRSIKFS